jgi:hypothetical protein
MQAWALDQPQKMSARPDLTRGGARIEAGKSRVQDKIGDENINCKIESPKHEQHLDPPQTQRGNKTDFFIEEQQDYNRSMNVIDLPSSFDYWNRNLFLAHL